MSGLWLAIVPDVSTGVVPDYAAEWLTPPSICPDTLLPNGTGVAVNPFNSTATSTFGECCTFCHSQTRQLCVAWTWHQTAGTCYVSDRSTPHESNNAISGVSPAPPPTPLPRPKPPLGFQPNFVFILTDDQDRYLGPGGYDSLGSLQAMPQLRKHLMDEGSLVENFYVNTPICCPSRTEFFTGRYFHNVGPPRSPGSCMHADTKQAWSNETGLFGLLSRAGYATGIFGKVTNDQGPALKTLAASGSAAYIDSPVDYNNYDGTSYFRLFANGSTSTETLHAKAPEFGTTYQTTQIGNRTLRWLDSVVGGPRPFFAYLGPHAPHYPAEPAPWHRDMFLELAAPRTPNYNASGAGKAQHVRQNPPLTALAKCWEDQHFRDRWASLLAVDDLVGELFAMLSSRGALSRTFVLYSSDHGYKLGQWRIGTSKEHPYESDIRVPFFIRGPGVAAGANYTRQISGNVDVLPTMLELAAGAEFVRAVDPDGRSMAPFLVKGLPPAAAGAWRDHFINEYYSVGTYYNDHSNCWQDGQKTTDACGGAMPRGPAGHVDKCVEASGEGDGRCYFVDSTHSNSWRQLRVLNATHNLNYIEYDPAWKWLVSDATGAGLQHYELYNISSDPYQMHNLYSVSPNATRAALHAQLAGYYNCSGVSCP